MPVVAAGNDRFGDDADRGIGQQANGLARHPCSSIFCAYPLAARDRRTLAA